MPRQKVEFPKLAEAGLYAAHTEGNGNCLFHALADQLYGDQARHLEVRAEVAKYLRAHADDFKPFITVNEGAGWRRNPKRKNAGASSSFTYASPPTQDQIDAQFEAFMATVEQSGTYGDNLEVNAFSNAYDVHVKIWHYDGHAWLSRTKRNQKGTKVVHLALHDYEHYSSVRNSAGPHSGLPNVKDQAAEGDFAVEVDPGSPLSSSEISPWKVRLVERSLPYIADTTLIQRTLVKHNGNIDEAINDLLGNESGSSGRASTPGSSSIERDQDEKDEEEYARQRKKQDRRQSRATKLASFPSEQITIRPKLNTAVTQSDTLHPTGRPKISPARAKTIVVDDSESEEDDKAEKLSSSDSSAPSITAPRLKLSQPKPQGQSKLPSKEAPKKEMTKQGSQSTARPPQDRPIPVHSDIATSNATTQKNPKPQQRQAGSGSKPRVSASAAKDLKKRAQKAASKERKQELAAAVAAGGRGDKIPAAAKTSPHAEVPSAPASSTNSKRPIPPTNHFGTLLI